MSAGNATQNIISCVAHGAILMMMSLAFWILECTIITTEGPSSLLGVALGGIDRKGLLAAALYAVAIPLALLNQTLSQIIYIGVALLYLVPDPRIEGVIAHE